MFMNQMKQMTSSHDEIIEPDEDREFIISENEIVPSQLSADQEKEN